MNSEEEYVYIDGKFVPKNEATISIHDVGFQYGWSVFEGIRVYNNKIFKLDEHVNRLFDSANAVGIQIPISRDKMKKIIIATARKNKIANGRLKPIVTRGKRDIISFDPRHITYSPSIVIIAEKTLLSYKEEKEEGERVIFSSVRRNSPQCVDPKIKCCNYMNNILAKIEAARQGVHDAFMLDINGFVAEATSANIFIIKYKKIFTPTTENCLDGITRRTIIDLARKEGLQIEVRHITPSEVYNADEVFVTSTGGELRTIIEVDGRTIGDGKRGPVTTHILKLYQQTATHGTSINSTCS